MTKMFRALQLFSFLGVSLSMADHLFVVYRREMLLPEWSTLLLQIGAIGSVAGMVLLGAALKKKFPKMNQNAFFKVALIRPVWPMLLLGGMMFYTMTNFMANAGVGTFQIRDGRFVETDRGTVRRTFPTRARFEAAKRRGALKTRRAFNGHWMFFYGASFLILFAGGARREELEKWLAEHEREYEEEYQRVKEEFRNEGGTQPKDRRPALGFGARYWKHRGVKTMVLMMGGQALVVGVALSLMKLYVGAFFLVFFLLFGMGVNLLSYLWEARYYLHRVQFSSESVLLEYYHFGTRHDVEIPLQEFELSVEREEVRSGIDVYLEGRRNGKRVFRQLCQKELDWEEARVEAVVDEWNDRLAEQESPSRESKGGLYRAE